MNPGSDIQGNEKKEVENRQKEEYIKLWKHYKAESDKIYKFLIQTALWLTVAIVILISIDKFTGFILLTNAQYFFLFVSLFASWNSILLHWRYKNLLGDPLSDFSEEVGLLASNKSFNKRIANNRKAVRNITVPFRIAILSSIMVILLWLISPMKKDDTHKQNRRTNSSSIIIDLLQINDVYEISPLDSNRIGGMARIATLKKQFLKQNKNSLLIMAGDFISPSVFNSVKLNDETVSGKQMITAMNAAGVDLTIFGNHEFDFKYPVLQQRIDESWFQWIASNVYNKKDSGHAVFKKKNIDIPAIWKKIFTNAEGISFTIGFFGLTAPENKGSPEYATYDSTLAIAKKMFSLLAPVCDAVIAVTHQNIKDDSILAMQIPQLTAIIGGHEHDMHFTKVGNVYITKAHSNAKSAFHLRLTIDKNNNPTATVTPELIPIDTSIQQDYLCKTIAEGWMNIAMKYFKSSGFSPNEEVCNNFKVKLDGRDAEVRSGQTNLTRLITDAMLWAGEAKGCKVAILNAGSIRVDDIITPPVSQYSFLRALPYESKIYVAEMKGWFIKNLLDSASHLKDEGAFLQYSVRLGKASIANAETYKVAIGDYLLSGRQNKLEFVNHGKPGIIAVDTAVSKDENLSDLRMAIINYIKKYCGNKVVLHKYQD